METYKGKPENADGRLPREMRVYDLLDSLGIEYIRADHKSAYTMEDCKAIDDALGVIMCKNLFLCTANQKQYFMLLMPDDKPFKTKDITAQIGTGRLSFGSSEKMLEYLDIEPGAVSIMGLMNDHDNHVQLLVDKDILSEEFLGCHPCVNTSSLKLKTADVFKSFINAVHHDMKVVELKVNRD